MSEVAEGAADAVSGAGISVSAGNAVGLQSGSVSKSASNGLGSATAGNKTCFKVVSWNINSLDSTIAAAAADKTRCKGGLSNYVDAREDGVVTYVRKTAAAKGIAVIAASGRIFEDPEFDDEGRCIVTDHGSFVLFNVYVPNAGDERSESGEKLRPRLQFKLRFLEALRQQALKAFRMGKGVMLVGDLNVSPSRADVGFSSMLAKNAMWWGYSQAEMAWMDGLIRVASEEGLIPSRDTAACRKVTHRIFNWEVSPLESRPVAPNADGLVLVDTFRSCFPNESGIFSVWETRTGGRDANQGCRIDLIAIDTKWYVECLEATDDAGAVPLPFERDAALNRMKNCGTACVVDTPRSWSDHAAIAFVFVVPSYTSKDVFGVPLSDPKCIWWSQKITKLTPGQSMSSFFAKVAPVVAAVEAEAEAAIASVVAPGSVSAISGLKRARARLLELATAAPTALATETTSAAADTGDGAESSSSGSDVDVPEAKRSRTNRSTVFG